MPRGLDMLLPCLEKDEALARQFFEGFDEEGFYRIGDAGRLVDEAHPEQGVLFDGRVAEDFKLGSGTWVSVGTHKGYLNQRAVIARRAAEVEWLYADAADPCVIRID